MANPELVSYIKQMLGKGALEETVKVALRGAGWQETDISAAFSEINPVKSTPVNPTIVAPASMPSMTIATEPARTPQISITSVRGPEVAGPDKLGISPAITEIVKQKEFTTAKKTNGLLKKILIGLGGLAVISGASVFFYFRIYQNPERILAKAALNLQTLKSGTYSLGIAANLESQNNKAIPGLLQANANFDAVISGQFDLSSAQDPKLSASTSANTNVFSESAATPVSAVFENDTVFVKSSNPPALLFNIPSGVFRDRWIKIDVSKNLPATIMAALSRLKSDAVFSSVLSPEILTSGDQSYHYAFVINNASLKNILTIAFQGNADLLNALPSVQNANGQIWINKKTFIPAKLSLEIPISGDVSGSVKFTLEAESAKPANIEEPAGAKTIEEIILEEALLAAEKQKESVPAKTSSPTGKTTVPAKKP